MDKRQVLDRLAEDRTQHILLGQLWDKYERTRTKNSLTHSVFLSPQEQTLCCRLFGALGVADDVLFSGGYEGAERKQAYFLPDWMQAPTLAIQALRCRWYRTETLSHRDILGSLMGLGITRESVGDILVGAQSADLLVAEEIAPFLLQEYRQAGHSALQVEQISLSDVTVPQAAFREIRGSLSSLRLDSVVSAAFSLARGKSQEAICAGRVFLNTALCEKPDRQVAQGDTISVRGLGKCELSCVGSLTKKGRIGITVKRYL